ncbi:TrmH family RNA methyltransferase [Paenimyroides viscosum]|uniref:tRNA (guanosine(18)-2'-O)-methyltransferase n=1 Tax=Paenimyroides viscosum TaxID=2488729 RepID=A0A3P1B5S5_9FLAO|nr:RNA methyltransferase [Paenimyroides viscosum]RRA96319.1 TrmH family RNA methyltransferase [Paenimyroides viscosum]
MNLNDLYKSIDYKNYLEGFITENRKLKFNKVLENRTKHFCIAVEDVYQLHNTSAVMRSCEVFGIQNLHMIEQKFSKTIDKEIALGAEKWVDIYRHTSTQNCLESLKKQGYQIVATSPHADAHTLDNFDISKPSAIFFGTEKNGLSQEIMDQADTFIKIPMYGFTESLNISVSAALVINSITNKLRTSALDWKLSEEDLLAKKIDWMRKSIKDIDFVTQRYILENNK